MEGDHGVICHVQCEISSVSVRGLGSGGGELFLRCHVPAGGGRSIRIDSRGGAGETDGGGTAVMTWRDVASLSCDGSPASVRELVGRGTVVFEVRRRRGGGGGRRPVLLGRALGSEFVGRAEVPWKDAGGSDDVAVPVELTAASSRRRAAGEEAPAAFLTARMRVRVTETTTPVPAGRRRADSPAHPHWQSSGEWSVGDEDVFAAAVACAADDAFE